MVEEKKLLLARINQSNQAFYISLSINVCLKIYKITKVIKLHFASEKIIDYYLQKFEYAMENIRLGQQSISSTAKSLTQDDT